jgi:hypothetical protein
VVAVCAAGATACSGQQGQPGGGQASAGAAPSSQGSAVKVVQAAYDKTTAAHTAKIRVCGKIQVQGKAQTFTGHGVANFDAHAARFTEKLPRGAGSVQVRYLNKHVYAKLPKQAASKISGGKQWIGIDLAKVAQQKYGASLQQLQQNLPSNPTEELTYLRAVSKNGVHDLGKQTVHGVGATHYKATVDLDKAAKQQKPAAQHALQQLEKQVGTSTLPVQVWIDKQGRVVQMRFTEHLHPQQKGGDAKASGPVDLTVTEALSDFGTPAHVSAPPQSKTTDITQKLLGAGH